MHNNEENMIGMHTDLAWIHEAVPTSLHACFKRNQRRYLDALAKELHDQQIDIEIPVDFHASLHRIFSVSEFVSDQFSKAPLLPLLAYQEGLPIVTNALLQRLLCASSHEPDNFESLKKRLRDVRQQQTSLIIWRFILGKTNLVSHLQELSLLADVIIQCAVQAVINHLNDVIGEPIGITGEPLSFIIIALGKLGGEELNFSSDIDLLFCYSDDGTIPNCKTPISVEQFYTRAAQLLIELLSEITQDGFVYRVDMRLRPYGESGALVMTLDQLEQYYQYQGRDWERYALIKARIITGNQGAQSRLKEIIQPFVYRRYLDYSAFESLREMKAKIELDVKKNNRLNDIKLGKGGIRQIEFIAQAFQLIRGGKNPDLQKSNLLETLHALKQHQVIPDNKHHSLFESYTFLRKLEHLLQMMQDMQTHQLPAQRLDQEKLAFAFGKNSYDALLKDLYHHLEQVSYYFETLSAVPKSVQTEHQTRTQTAKLIWDNQLSKETLSPTLALSQSFFDQIAQFRDSALVRNLKPKAKMRLDAVMPMVIDIVMYSIIPDELLMRSLKFLRAIVRRSAYLVFLIEKEGALVYLLKIFEKSEWINKELCEYPVLLDDILTPLSVNQIHDKQFWQTDLSQKLKGIPYDDLEQLMEKLRQFKRAGLMNIALHELLEKKEVHISLALNHLTETILECVYHIGLDFIQRQYSLNNNGATIIDVFPFALIAYGKLGATELTYISDLDLVFLYDDLDASFPHDQYTNEIYIRLAQRIIHILSTPTLSGKLFDIDVRLRPGGSAGMLASSFSGFEKYLDHQAWIWEQQALVNARFITGSISLKSKFESIRKKTLTYPRNEEKLKRAISEMRNKMIEHNSHSTLRNVKTVQGGMVDIEFIVQYAVLYFAYQYPEITEPNGTLGILAYLKTTQFLPEIDVQMLTEAYTYYQFLQNNQLLQAQDKFSMQSFAAYQTQVKTIWENIFSF